MDFLRDDKIQISVYNPLLILSLSWLSILILYASYPIGVLYNSNGFGISYILLLILVSLFLSVFVGFKQIFYLDIRTLELLGKKKAYTRTFFSLGIVEILIKGLPPVFTSGDYINWGISGLHGFINILGLFVCYWNFLLFVLLKRDRKKYLIIIFCVFLWQILVLNRAIIMLNGIGLLYISVCIKRFKISHICLAVFSMVYLMGLVGDLRGMGGEYIFLVANPKPWAEELGVGFVWVVTYFTTAISNLMYNIELGKVFAFEPFVFLNEFLPNVFKVDLSDSGEMKLYNGLFNASTIVRPAFIAFGIFGPMIAFALLIFVNYFYYTRVKSFQWFILMTFLSAASVLSCYENTIFTPWLIFMFLLSIDFNLFKME